MSTDFSGSCVSKRQIEKARAKTMKGTYFLINWLNEGEENLFDVVASKSVVPPDGVDILDVSINTECRVSFSGQFYKARVVDYGTEIEMKKCQKKKDQSAKDISDRAAGVERSDLDNTVTSHLPESSETVDSDIPVKSSNEIATPMEPKLFISPEIVKSTIPVKSPKEIATPVKVKRGLAVAPKKWEKCKKTLVKKPKSAASRLISTSKTAFSHGTIDVFSGSESESDMCSLEDEKKLSGDLCEDNEYETRSIRKKPLSQTKLIDIAKQEWQRSRFTEPLEKRQRTDMDCYSTLFKPELPLQRILDRLKDLEATTKKLNSKVKSQALQIEKLNQKYLQAPFSLSTTPLSSAGTPLSSAGTPLSSAVSSASEEQGSQQHCNESEEIDIPGDTGHILICGIKVDRLRLQSAKMQPSPAKCALQLMSTLFSTQEMVNGNPSGVTKSKDESRKKNICQLDPKRIKYIQDFIEERWQESFAVLSKKLTQKCTDLYNSRKDLRRK